MNEPEYRKIQCGAGHWCEPVSHDNTLPRQCPICGMPYDRRHNKPVFCFVDGSIPDETEVEDNITETTNTSPEIKSEVPEQPSILRRQRVISNISTSPAETEIPEQQVRRRHIIGNTNIPQPVNEVPAENKSYYNPAPNGRFVLKCGQYRISVSEEGMYLGREENGREIFGADFMISRRHCFVKINRFDEVLITDANSLNGTFVDDGTGRRRIGNNETVALKVGQKVYLADFVFVIDKF